MQAVLDRQTHRDCRHQIVRVARQIARIEPLLLVCCGRMHLSGVTKAMAACRQAYERQVDALGRALKRGEVDGQDLGQERHSLLQQLRAAEQVGRMEGRVALDGIMPLHGRWPIALPAFERGENVSRLMLRC